MVTSDNKFPIVAALPFDGSGYGDIRLVADTVELVVEFEHRHDGKDFVGGVRFHDVIAHRFFDEMRSHGFVPGCYDTVVEVRESEWKDEMIKNESEGLLRSAVGKKHFALFLSNNGYLEAIAASCELLADREGMLN